MAEQEKQNQAQVMAILGTAMLLARRSPLHVTYRLAEFVDRVWPSLIRGQYALYTDKASGKPAGFCSWTWVSEEVLDEYKNNRPVKPDDWDSGDILFFQEIIATDGHLRHIIRDLRNNVVRHVEEAYALRGFIRDEGEEDKKQRVMRFTGLGETSSQPDKFDRIRPV